MFFVSVCIIFSFAVGIVTISLYDAWKFSNKEKQKMEREEFQKKIDKILNKE